MRLECKSKKPGTEETQSGIPAALTGWCDPVDPEHSDLRTGPDDNGHALISPYWAIWFLDGTREEQEKQLRQYRADPSYQTPPAETKLQKLLVRYINGASFESVMCKIAKRREAKTIAETLGVD
jgi:hypothetical protein